MHPTMFAAFDAICRAHVAPGARVLEIGAMAADDTLLRLPALRGASLRAGCNLGVERPLEGAALVRVAADGLAAFADAAFDAVLCNSVLEHDRRFWRTLDGIRRVARPGALIAIGVPGYAELPPPPALRVARRLARLPGVAALLERAAPGWAVSTATLVVHDHPADYYRFSDRAMRAVLLEGCRDVQVQVLMHPPRILGFGWRA